MEVEKNEVGKIKLGEMQREIKFEKMKKKEK